MVMASAGVKDTSSKGKEIATELDEAAFLAKYKMGQELGRGSYSIVKRATNRQTKEKVTLSLNCIQYIIDLICLNININNTIILILAWLAAGGGQNREPCADQHRRRATPAARAGNRQASSPPEHHPHLRAHRDQGQDIHCHGA